MKPHSFWSSYVYLCLCLLSSSILIGQDLTHLQFSGHIFFHNTTECSEESHGLGPLTNHSIQFENPVGDAFIIETNDQGQFTVDTTLTSNIFSLIPDTLSVGDDYLNGVTTYDMVLISKHILQLEIIECPFTRIAADVNNSGTITTLDMVFLRTLILGMAHDLPVRSWRIAPRFLVPRSYSFQHITPFIDGFWGNANYPFDAKLRLQGEEYDYRGDTDFPASPGETSWMTGIRNWAYLPEDPSICRLFSYDFVAIKSGDINGNASISGVTRLMPNFTNVSYTLKDPASSTANQAMELAVKVKSKKRLEAYQLGLKIDPNFIKVNSFQAVEARLRQSLRDNYNNEEVELQAGNVKTSWNIDYELEKEGIDINEFTEIMRIDVTLAQDIYKDTDMSKLAYFDRTLLPVEFISQSGLLEEAEVEVLIELRPKQ